MRRALDVLSSPCQGDIRVVKLSTGDAALATLRPKRPSELRTAFPLMLVISSLSDLSGPNVTRFEDSARQLIIKRTPGWRGGRSRLLGRPAVAFMAAIVAASTTSETLSWVHSKSERTYRVAVHLDANRVLRRRARLYGRVAEHAFETSVISYLEPALVQ